VVKERCWERVGEICRARCPPSDSPQLARSSFPSIVLYVCPGIDQRPLVLSQLINFPRRQERTGSEHRVTLFHSRKHRSRPTTSITPTLFLSRFSPRLVFPRGREDPFDVLQLAIVPLQLPAGKGYRGVVGGSPASLTQSRVPIHSPKGNIPDRFYFKNLLLTPSVAFHRHIPPQSGANDLPFLLTPPRPLSLENGRLLVDRNGQI
jgi:hypothetical protein